MNWMLRSAFVALLLGTMPAFARVSAEQRLRDALVARGYTIGFDEDKDQFLFLGRQVAQVGEKDPDTVLALRRPCLARRAELRAKSRLLQALRGRAYSGNRLRVEADSRDVKHQTDSLFALFAENTLSGWQVLDSAEVLENGIYEVAVAVVWSQELEEAGRAAREGRLRPSATWQNDCEAWLDAQDLSLWTGTRVFRDSTGFPHLLGVGSSVLVDENPLQMKIVRKKADMRARGSLLLGLFGDAEIGRYASSRMLLDSATGSEFDTQSAYMDLANVEVKGKAVMGMMPVYERVVEHPLMRRKILIVVYGVRPQTTAKGTGGVSDFGPQTGASTTGLMIFNPNTGKYEKR